MVEQERLAELKRYQILDTPPEQELDEIASIASVLCGTPISLLTLLDDRRQWFKANLGFNLKETPLDQAFCQFTFAAPNEVLVVNDSLNDERFRHNPLVVGEPYIRFYAGAPLQSPRGYVLGTLCVIDKVPRHITDNQKNALQLLAKRAMRYLELRRTLNRQQQQIKEGSQQLQHLFNLAPGVFFRAEQRPNHPFILIFISKTVSKILPTLNIRELKSEPGAAYAFVVPEDLDSLKKDISQAGSQQVPFSSEFRINTPRQQEWCRLTAAPEVAADNKVIWHGSLQIITAKKQYVEILEQILFDISHTIRRPVATIQGLTHLIELNTITEPGLRDLAGHLKQVATEMDDHIRHLNSVYYTLQNRENSQ